MKIFLIKYDNFRDKAIIKSFSKLFKNDILAEELIDASTDVKKLKVLEESESIVIFISSDSQNDLDIFNEKLHEKNLPVLYIFDNEVKKVPPKVSNEPNIEIIISKDFNSNSLAKFSEFFFNSFIKTKANSIGQISDFNFTLEKVFENKGVGVTLADFNGNILKCNKAFSKMLKYSEEEIKNSKFVNFTYKDDLKKTNELFKELVSGKRDHYSIEKRYLRKDGKIIWVDLTVTVINDELTNQKYTLGLSVNITGRKEIEQKLESEQEFSLRLLDNSTDSIYFKDIESRFIKVNKSCVKKLGFKKESEVIGKTDFDIFSREHAQKAYNDEQKIIKTGKPIIAIEEKEIWADGRITYVSTTKLPLKDAKGKIVGTFGITRDITKQKEAEINLAKEKERAELIYRLIPSAIFTVDTDKKITSWNERAEEITGYKYDEVIGKKCDIINTQPCNSYCGLFEKKMLKPILGQKCLLKTKDGRTLLVSKNIDYLTDNENNIVGGIESFEDITESNEYEKIQAAQFEISEAVNSTPDITTLYKKIHDVVRSLMHAENFYIALYDEENELISFPYFVDEFDDPPETRKLRKGLTEYVLKTGKDVLVDKKKDEELKSKGEVELLGEMQSIWLGIPLKIEEKVIGVMAVQDYTNEKVYGEKEKQILLFVSELIATAIEKKKSHDELKRYSEELKQLNITKDKFFSIIAHDLKNPFITLLGFSDMLVHDYDDLTDEEKLTFIKDIRDSAKLSHELLENLLDWSRSQTGKISYEPHIFDIHELVSRNVLLLNPMAKTKGIKLICEVVERTFVYADYEMVNTVIRNLISNAVKFTNKDGIIKVYTKHEDNSLVLCVEDNGVGMDSKTLDKLFMLGEQHTTKGTSKESGTGLGLILCKEFIEQNKGEITAESEVGKGSTFCIKLPTDKN